MLKFVERTWEAFSQSSCSQTSTISTLVITNWVAVNTIIEESEAGKLFRN